MADLYLKALESERKSLWASCRLKGLARDSKERLRIVELDTQIAAHKAKAGNKPETKAAPRPAAKAGATKSKAPPAK